jgi:hypothetical protein
VSKRARSGDQTPSDRRQVGLTVPRAVKERMTAAARVMDWSVGDWVLAAAAEFGPQVPNLSGELRKRPAVPDATFCALYLTIEERNELDDQATTHGLNRSAFVTASAQLALGAEADDVARSLQTGADVPLGASKASERGSRA